METTKKLYLLDDWVSENRYMRIISDLNSEPMDLESPTSDLLFMAEVFGQPAVLKIFRYKTIAEFEYCIPNKIHDQKTTESNMHKIMSLRMFARLGRMVPNMPEECHELMENGLQCCIEFSNGDVALIPLDPYSLVSLVLAKGIDVEGFENVLKDIASQSAIENILGKSNEI